MADMLRQIERYPLRGMVYLHESMIHTIIRELPFPAISMEIPDRNSMIGILIGDGPPEKFFPPGDTIV
jgi:hypothetical protein